MITNRLKLLAALITAAAMASTAHAFDYDLSWHTIDGGGGTVAAGAFELSGTIGQHDAGAMTGGTFELAGGFWFSIPAGDCNSTGSVDLLDHAEYASCLSGSGVALPSPDCACIDFDGDNDADLFDFAELQNAFTGT